MKGVTHDRDIRVLVRAVSIHTPNEGSDDRIFRHHSLAVVSIHTPNEGSDMAPSVPSLTLMVFQSTLPMKGVTQYKPVHIVTPTVSIHTPNEGSDTVKALVRAAPQRFNPHSQ